MMKIDEIKNLNYKILNPDYKARLKKALEKQFFMKLIGFEITKIEPGYIEGELIIEEKHNQQHDFLHGGLMASCLDIVMGFSAFTLLPANKALQYSETVFPIGVSAPRPVTTTRFNSILI